MPANESQHDPGLRHLPMPGNDGANQTTIENSSFWLPQLDWSAMNLSSIDLVASGISPGVEDQHMDYELHQDVDILNTIHRRSPSVITPRESPQNAQETENARGNRGINQSSETGSEAYAPSSVGSARAITDIRQEGTGDWPSEFSLDTRRGYSNQLIGLSCESDPYLLRNYYYNKYDTYPMYRLDFRKMKDDASVQPFLETSAYGNSRLPADSPPVQFVMTHEDIWKDSQKFIEAIQSGGSTEESDLELLKKIVPADLGPRLLKLTSGLLHIGATNEQAVYHISPLYNYHVWQAMVIARPLHLNDDSWDVSPLTVNDFEGYEIQNAEIKASALRHTPLCLAEYELSVIAADVLKEFYTLKAVRSSSTLSELLNRAQPLRARIENWRQSLPLLWKLASELDEREFEDGASLRLSHLTLEILIFRALLRPLFHQAVSASEVSQDPIFKIFDNCLPVQKWEQKSYLRSKRNISLYFGIHSPTKEIATQNRALLNRWRETLRAQSQVWPLARLATIRLDAAFWKGLSLVIHGAGPESQAALLIKEQETST
uniref:Transcriptional activator protein DAL81 n=1 Tax=Talaromyces marneffei PM1 TaxID=1077442 RepID=A0A093UYT5_TALMA